MRRSTRRPALALAAVWLLVALCAAVSRVHAATEDSPRDDEMFLNDAAAHGEQGLNKLLHWAIEHSNPEELKQQALEAGSQEQTKSLQERKKEFDEMMAHAKQLPTEAEIMNLSLAIAANSTEDTTTRVDALKLLQELVEDIDLANDLPGMGGIGILADCIVTGGELQMQALRVTHTAAANNAKFQMKVLETEAGIVPWLLQELYILQEGDICEASENKLENMLIALRTIAAMSRNLATSTTLYLQGLDGFPVGTDCFASESGSNECDKPHILPPSLRILFMLAQMSAACIDSEDAAHVYKQNAHANIARVAIGLLSDLVANDGAVQTILKSKPAPPDVWQAGVFWQGMCTTVQGKRDLPQHAINLLQNMFEPSDPSPFQDASEGDWPCLTQLLRDSTGAQAACAMGSVQGCAS